MKGKLLGGIMIIMMTVTLAMMLAAPASGQEQASMAPAASAGITIENAVICQNVVNRAPVGTGDIFAGDIEKVFCFCKVMGASEPTEITFNWYYQGSLKSTVKLPVRSTSWRTWSSKTIVPEMTGEWMVEILAADGAPLESIIFFIQ